MLLLAVLVGVGALSTQAAGRRLPARSEPSVRPSIPLRCPRLVAFFVRLHPDGGPSDLGRLVHPISAPSMPHRLPGPVTLIYTSPSPNNPPKPDCEGGLSDTTVLVWYPASLRGAKALRHQRSTASRSTAQGRWEWQEVSLPKLGFVIYTEGPEARAVLHTLTYSARAALAKLIPAPAVPANWGG